MEQKLREIASKIGKIGGDIDGGDFKELIFGIMFYRFISEDFANFMKGDDETINYKTLPDKLIPKEVIVDVIGVKGYFIFPSQLFCNIVELINNNHNNSNLNLIKKINYTLKSIENSAISCSTENFIEGIFSAINFKKAKTEWIVALFNSVAELDFGQFGKDESYNQFFEYLGSFLQAQNK